ncbi:Transglutaminase-like superfamily protein [Sphingobium sp. AP50]|uniref:lasso peptide biosynthesis B2 protein n=1 Tax=Sphingobium sp. AP50 TaxID=1884369 RepID=UPI0008D02917|nr:lasso peptide biosynthesis B2 protein [Sphingobium sp. AP50]SEK03942.1 Transglutaminase-like superfamily protein [Sphingobium sp. AP50]
MAYMLRAGVTFCTAANRHFFLDRDADRYFALGEQDQHLFSALLAMDPDIMGQTSLSPALALFLRQGEGRQLQPFAARHPAVAGMEVGTPIRPSFMLILRAALAYLHAKIRLRQRTVGNLLAELAHSKPSVDVAPEVDGPLGELAAAFDRLRVWTGEDQCLAMSLGYARIAYRMGYPVDIIFGISPRPFSAHCWVQLGDRALNDRLSRVEVFTPVYAQ